MLYLYNVFFVVPKVSYFLEAEVLRFVTAGFL